METKDTVKTVKQEIKRKEWIDPDEQFLTFAGKELEDDRTLSQCDQK